MRNTAPFLFGLLGVAVGAILTAALLPRRDLPPRSSGHIVQPDVVRLERALASVAEQLDDRHTRAASERPEETTAESRGAVAQPEQTSAATRLSELVQRPTADDRLRELGALDPPQGRNSKAIRLGRALGDRFRFKTYREILEEFGRPTGVFVNQYGTHLRYGFKCREGKWKAVSFCFTDGFVYTVSVDLGQ